MSYNLCFTNKAKNDIDFHKKSGNKSIQKKLIFLLEELAEHPFTGAGKPEPLKYELSGCWSRRINKEHRLIYELEDNRILIHSLRGHYHT